MIDKVKNVLKWIVLPLTALFGLLWYLFNKITSLKTQLAQSEAEKNLAGTLGKLEDAKNESKNAEDQFARDLAEYEHAKGSSGSDGDTK